MKSITKYIVAASLLLTAGCCPCRFSTKHAKPLVGTVWHLVQLSGADIDIEPSHFDIEFRSDGKLSGIGACNRFNAAYTTTANHAIDIGTIASTRMFCPGTDREQKLFRELDDASHYEIDGPMLLILNDGEIRAIFKAVETPASAKNAE